jgi:cysteine desulfurase
VLDSCRWLSQQGFEITYLPVLPSGLVSLPDLKAALRPDTSLVSIMMVNNEIGVIQPMAEISRTIKEFAKENNCPKAFFHTDAAQAVGKIPIDVEAMGIDAMSISAHKIYVPKGVGAAYVRRRPRVRLEPLIHGGGQERGLRSGTVPSSLVAGLGEACRIAKIEMEADHKRVKALADRLIEGLTSQVEHIVRNGDPSGYPGCVNLSFAYVEGESLLMALKVSVSGLFMVNTRVDISLTRRRISPSHPDPPAPRPRSNPPMSSARSAPQKTWRTRRSDSGSAGSRQRRKLIW